MLLDSDDDFRAEAIFKFTIALVLAIFIACMIAVITLVVLLSPSPQNLTPSTYKMTPQQNPEEKLISDYLHKQKANKEYIADCFPEPLSNTINTTPHENTISNRRKPEHPKF